MIFQSCIIIKEKLPHGAKHEVYFDSEKLARAAYKKMIAFWELNGHDAILVEGRDRVISVSSDIVASVTLLVGTKKIAQRKASK